MMGVVGVQKKWFPILHLGQATCQPDDDSDDDDGVGGDGDGDDVDGKTRVVDVQRNGFQSGIWARCPANWLD